MTAAEKKKKEAGVPVTVTVTDENVFSSFDDYEPTVTMSAFVYWILPVLAIVLSTRFLVDPYAASGWGIGAMDPFYDPSIPNPVPIRPAKAQAPVVAPTTPAMSPTPMRPKKKHEPLPTFVLDKPTSYQDAVTAIRSRRLNWDNTDSSSMVDTTDSTTADPVVPEQRHSTRGASSDPVRSQVMGNIDALREAYKADPENLFKVIELADALRVYDVQYHDGGTVQEEAIQSYKTAISLALAKRQEKLELGEETKSANVPEEMAMQYSSRSIDGILCAMYTSIGKVFFMSNMFENSEEYYTKALDLEPMYLDAMSARGSARLILGHYEDAAQDFTTVMENDTMGRFFDVYTGLSKILQARESAAPIGWGPIIESLNEMIPQLEHQYKSLQNNDYGGKQTMIAKTLSRLFHVLFLYNDVKTKDTDAAWKHLSRAYEYKMSAIPAWNSGLELQKIATTKKIFTRNFWPDGVGSQSAAPIFIIGFVRSGSTLLERVLDAHPQIVGTGENSVFNGRLDEIRNKIVQTSLLGDEEALTTAISSMADGVVDEMKERWVNGFSGDRTDDQPYPERFADKMLTNYYNVGFIHMLFPQALILHVIREPMDTIFSAYKHDFPAGTLDYTSDFEPLAELYEAYRELMDHWDRELPGRVTHIRYEDMVHDMPGVAKKIIEATNLDWDDSILDFHKKKHAVNTLSTTQVRKGVYKDSLLAWRRYEKHLGPLLELVGERTKYDIKTSLPGYKKPPPSTPSADDGDDDEKRKEEPERGNSSEKTEVVDTKDEL